MAGTKPNFVIQLGALALCFRLRFIRTSGDSIALRPNPNLAYFSNIASLRINRTLALGDTSLPVQPTCGPHVAGDWSDELATGFNGKQRHRAATSSWCQPSSVHGIQVFAQLSCICFWGSRGANHQMRINSKQNLGATHHRMVFIGCGGIHHVDFEEVVNFLSDGSSCHVLPDPSNARAQRNVDSILGAFDDGSGELEDVVMFGIAGALERTNGQFVRTEEVGSNESGYCRSNDLEDWELALETSRRTVRRLGAPQIKWKSGAGTAPIARAHGVLFDSVKIWVPFLDEFWMIYVEVQKGRKNLIQIWKRNETMLQNECVPASRAVGSSSRESEDSTLQLSSPICKVSASVKEAKRAKALGTGNVKGFEMAWCLLI
ncbi:hypothetical protein B0H13DRAFT_1860601 [Mycena leptocephala]|nr:hypothetical protein B0H13DRAFT_1860601 [Mycena leptocephala]